MPSPRVSSLRRSSPMEKDPMQIEEDLASADLVVVVQGLSLHNAGSQALQGDLECKNGEHKEDAGEDC